MKRLILNLATGLSLALLVSTVALWARSYRTSDRAEWLSCDGRGTRVVTVNGIATLADGTVGFWRRTEDFTYGDPHDAADVREFRPGSNVPDPPHRADPAGIRRRRRPRRNVPILGPDGLPPGHLAHVAESGAAGPGHPPAGRRGGAAGARVVPPLVRGPGDIATAGNAAGVLAPPPPPASQRRRGAMRPVRL